MNGRTMIVTTPLNHVYALDAVTGKKLWQYDHPLPKVALRTVCCDVVNRGVALYGDMAYEATLDNHVVALDARTGKVVWETAVEAPGIGYAMSGAPLAIRGKIIIGDGGGEYASRGFLVALDAKTGKEVLALLHDARYRRARRQHLAGQNLPARRRRPLDDQQLRPGNEYAVYWYG